MAEQPKWGIDPEKIPPAVRASEEPIVRFFAYHDAHPIALTMVLMEKFGPHWIEWEAETLRREIIETFKATSVSENNWNKIQAARTLLTATSFWAQWEVFEKIIQALNNNIPNFGMTQRCTISQLMAGVDCANQLRTNSFESEISYYITACAIDSGVTYLPPPIDFAQQKLSNPHYVCKDCGNVDPEDLSDGRCDFCTARYTDHHNLNGKPAPWIPDSVGRNVDKFLMRDPEPVRRKFEEIKNLESFDVDEESPVDVQAAKLVVAYKYTKMRAAQLIEQLKELKSWVTH